MFLGNSFKTIGKHVETPQDNVQQISKWGKVHSDKNSNTSSASLVTKPSFSFSLGCREIGEGIVQSVRKTNLDINRGGGEEGLCSAVLSYSMIKVLHWEKKIERWLLKQRAVTCEIMLGEYCG